MKTDLSRNKKDGFFPVWQRRKKQSKHTKEWPIYLKHMRHTLTLTVDIDGEKKNDGHFLRFFFCFLWVDYAWTDIWSFTIFSNGWNKRTEFFTELLSLNYFTFCADMKKKTATQKYSLIVITSRQCDGFVCFFLLFSVFFFWSKQLIYLNLLSPSKIACLSLQSDAHTLDNKM